MNSVDKKTFLRDFQASMDEDAAAFFLGAGMSRPSGFVDWKTLMHEIADDLGLDVNRETDLIALAQWHKNERKSRHKLNQKLVDEFTKASVISESHKLLAALPVSTIWTTNYDQLIEKAYLEAHKVLDVKRRPKDLATTRRRSHATLYKMHGDCDMPDEAVLTKEDYASFESRRGLFSVQLRGHLVAKSFLFLGYSFSDPNLDYILNRVRAALAEDSRNHFWVTRKVANTDYVNPADFAYQTRLQELRAEDLRNFGIQTLLIDDYEEVTHLLAELNRRAIRRNVFVSGSAHDFGPLGREGLEDFGRALGTEMIRRGYNLVSGLGLGVGGAVSVGALEQLYREPAPQIDDRLIIRPFPQVEPAQGTRDELWERHRKELIGKVGFAIFLAGNKLDPSNSAVVDASGVYREFELAVGSGATPIPVGATGHVAEKLATRVLDNPELYYKSTSARVVPHVKILADPTAGVKRWIEAVFEIMKAVLPA